MAVEAELATLLEAREQVMIRFNQANEVINQCKQEHAELTGAIKICEKLIAEGGSEGEVSCEVGMTE
jgi:hypothetical protein